MTITPPKIPTPGELLEQCRARWPRFDWTPTERGGAQGVVPRVRVVVAPASKTEIDAGYPLQVFAVQTSKSGRDVALYGPRLYVSDLEDAHEELIERFNFRIARASAVIIANRRGAEAFGVSIDSPADAWRHFAEAKGGQP